MPQYLSTDPNAGKAAAPSTGPMDSVYRRYPRLRTLGDVNVVDSRSGGMKDDRQLEYYPADERDNPKPGRPTIEIFNPAIQGQAYDDAIAADMLHGLKTADPQWRAMRQQYLQTLSPANKAMDQRAYAEDRKRGETRTFDQWMEDNRGDAYLRGYLFPDKVDEWRKQGVYDDAQKRQLERMRLHLTSDAQSDKYLSTDPNAGMSKPATPAPASASSASEPTDVFHKTAGENVAGVASGAWSRVKDIAKSLPVMALDPLGTETAKITGRGETNPLKATANLAASTLTEPYRIGKQAGEGTPEAIGKSLVDTAAYLPTVLGLKRGTGPLARSVATATPKVIGGLARAIPDDALKVAGGVVGGYYGGVNGAVGGYLTGGLTGRAMNKVRQIGLPNPNAGGQLVRESASRPSLSQILQDGLDSTLKQPSGVRVGLGHPSGGSYTVPTEMPQPPVTYSPKAASVLAQESPVQMEQTYRELSRKAVLTPEESRTLTQLAAMMKDRASRVGMSFAAGGKAGVH